MYLGEVHTQTQSMNAVCTATIQGMEQAIQSIDAFAIDTVLQGHTYSSAKSFFVHTFRPLAQGIIYLCEELIRQNNAFPNGFQSQVASTDVIEQEILEQIQGIDQTRANMEAISQTVPLPGTDAMMGIFDMMKRKLQEKLEHLHEFNYTSSSNYDTALQLAASIATGLAEVQSGKGFSPASGTFSTQGLNMEWATSIQSFEEKMTRKADNFVNSNLSGDNIEDSATFGKPSEKSMLRKIWDGVYVGSGQVIGGIVEGFDSLDDTVTKENIKYAIGHPLETFSTAWNTFSDSFMNDVWHGDLESGTKWGTNIFMELGLGWLGDKGISKVGKITTLSEGVNLAKFSEGISSVSNQMPLKDRFAFADMSPFKNELSTSKDFFIRASSGEGNLSKSGKSVEKRKVPPAVKKVDELGEYYEVTIKFEKNVKWGNELRDMNLRDFDRKVKKLQDLSDANLLQKTKPIRDPQVTKQYRKDAIKKIIEIYYPRDKELAKKLIDKVKYDMDPDHRWDLGLNREDIRSNLQFMDQFTNRRIGGLLGVQLKDAPYGSRVKINIERE